MSFLEVDESSLENRLILNKDENTDNMNSLLNEIVGNPTVPTKLITPIPGICVKAFTSTGDKVFINICHTEEIPPPKKNTIPMSIGNEKEIPDKHGKSCIAFDVALNSTFFNAHQNELVILTIIEGISNKHGLNFQENKYHILRNVKCKGKIGPMNIEQRPVKPDPQKKTLISEIKSKPETKVIPIDKAAPVPDFNLIKVDSPRKFYGSEIDLKNVISKDDISLQIGEDRIFLTTQGTTKYELEYHFPQLVNTDLCTSEFDPIAQEPDQVPSKEELLQSHLKNWASVRRKWHMASHRNEARYGASKEILTKMFERAQGQFQVPVDSLKSYQLPTHLPAKVPP